MSLEESEKVRNNNQRSGDQNMQFVLIILLIVFVISIIAILGSEDPSIDRYGNRKDIHTFGGYFKKVAYTLSHPLYEFGYRIVHLGQSSETEYTAQQQDGDNENATDGDK